MSMMQLFRNNYFYKSSIIDIWQNLECTYANCSKFNRLFLDTTPYLAHKCFFLSFSFPHFLLKGIFKIIVLL